MDLEHAIDLLRVNARRLRALIDGSPDEQIRWQPTPETWSILEVVCHLRDEEKEDFRVLLDYTFHRPGEKRPSINPSAWPTERHYLAQTLTTVLTDFQEARDDSIAWLQELADPDWEAIYTAPWGTIRAGDILAAWVAHDIFHLRQLVRLHWAYLNSHVAPYKVDYAGTW